MPSWSARGADDRFESNLYLNLPKLKVTSLLQLPANHDVPSRGNVFSSHVSKCALKVVRHQMSVSTVQEGCLPGPVGQWVENLDLGAVGGQDTLHQGD